MTSAFLFAIVIMWLGEKERKVMKNYKIIFVKQGRRSWYVGKLGSEPVAYAHVDLNTLEQRIRRDGHTFYHSWMR